jgi:hypothetical protein
MNGNILYALEENIKCLQSHIRQVVVVESGNKINYSS